MKKLINNENKEVCVTIEVYNALSKMRLDEGALIKDVAGKPHMIVIAQNF